MSEHHYEVTMDAAGSRITVNVFTNREVTKEQLKPLAIERGIEFMKEFGSKVTAADITLVGYIHRGKWS